jgi:hypothetical protein
MPGQKPENNEQLQEGSDHTCAGPYEASDLSTTILKSHALLVVITPPVTVNTNFSEPHHSRGTVNTGGIPRTNF